MDRDRAFHDVREALSHEHHSDALAAPPCAADAPVETRLAQPEDADGLAHCFYRAYGDTYDHKWVYKPNEIRRRWSEREMVSMVGLAPDGEVIGHLAANFANHKSNVAESGQGIVDPRYRGHHLFESIKKSLAEWAGSEGLYGLFSEATTAHPYSQRGNLAIGAHEMGFLIGYIPSGVDYKQTKTSQASRRKTAALMYLRTGKEPERMVHLPPLYRDMAMGVYENAGFVRTAATADAALSSGECSVLVQRDHDHNAVLLQCRSVGPNTCETISTQLETLKKEAVDCVYVDLPLADPGVVLLGEALSSLGFVFSCILPETREDGDELRLQYLHGVDPHIEEIATSSDFGRGLLAEIAASLAKTD